jgi:hypothetical protein
MGYTYFALTALTLFAAITWAADPLPAPLHPEAFQIPYPMIENTLVDVPISPPWIDDIRAMIQVDRPFGNIVCSGGGYNDENQYVDTGGLFPPPILQLVKT